MPLGERVLAIGLLVSGAAALAAPTSSLVIQKNGQNATDTYTAVIVWTE